MIQRIRSRSLTYSSLALFALLVYALLSTLVMQTNLPSTWTSIRIRRDAFPTPIPPIPGTSTSDRQHKTVIETLIESELSCPHEDSPEVRVRPFGTFADLPSGACSFKLASLEYPSSITQDFHGYRLPYYGSDATRLYRCRSFEMGSRTVLTTALTKSEEKLWEEATRNCSLDGNEKDILRFVAQKASLDLETIRSAVRTWLQTTPDGKLAVDAMRRVSLLENPQLKRKYLLIGEQNEWKRLLASDIGQQVFPDVNTHKVEVPPVSSQAMLVQNARIERNGRVTTLNAEVFYPKRAPYSHIALMESMIGNAMHRFSPSNSQREWFGAKIRSELTHAMTCLRAASSDEGEYTCGKRSDDPQKEEDVAVSKVLVISQTLGSQMFHYMCENLPRLGLYLEFLRANPSVHLHLGCPEKAGYCVPLLEMLGINRSRIVRGPQLVYAKKAMIPEGGRRHWPLGNLWGLMAIREAVMASAFPEIAGTHRTHCDGLKTEFDESTKSDRLIVRVAIVRRTLTRLTAINGGWYDRMLTDLKEDQAFALNLNVRLDLKMFDDRDTKVMGSALAQIQQLRMADVVIGAHGAALSWITYAQPCTHFISFRGRSNSDIFEHLSLGMGVPFHHILFMNDYSKLYQDVRRNLGIAIDELVQSRSTKGRKPIVAIACKSCTTEATLRLSKGFDLVLTGIPVNSVSTGNIIYADELNDKETECGSIMRNLIRKHVGIVFGAEEVAERPVYWGWIDDEELLVNPRFASFWVSLDRFDGVIFAQSASLKRPQLALFRAKIEIPSEICLRSSPDVKTLTSNFPGVRVALVISALEGTATSTDGRAFYVPSTAASEQAMLKTLAREIDMHGSHEVFPTKHFPCSLDFADYHIMLKKRDGSWSYRCPPLGALIERSPTVENLGYKGAVRLVEIPLTRASKLQCMIPLQDLTADRDNIQC